MVEVAVRATSHALLRPTYRSPAKCHATVWVATVFVFQKAGTRSLYEVRMPLVLVHNEVVRDPAHNWDDKEGVQYHYPSKYRGKVQTGEPFVYYRGVARKTGRRGRAEYLGHGKIGEIWPDEQKRGVWYCSVVDYERFAVPVDAKVDGETREQIPRNMWWDGVRTLDPAIYEQIMAEGLASAAIAGPIDADAVIIEAAEDLILPPAMAKHQNSRNDYSRSKRSKAIGDWAERAAMKFILEQIAGCSDCIHRAAIGETPGWDIDYRDAAGTLQRVEVKGTTAAAFSGIEFTANEMNSAKANGPAYWLCLVAGCETKTPRVQMIQDPAAKLAAGFWSAKPAVFEVRFAGATKSMGEIL